MNKTHELKSEPHQFEPMIAGQKVHDLRRRDDRQYNVGDLVWLREFVPGITDCDPGRHTGRAILAEITYITSRDNHCALSPQAIDERYCILSYKYHQTVPERFYEPAHN